MSLSDPVTWTLGIPSHTYTPPHTFIAVGLHLNLNHGGVSLTKLTCSSDLALVLFHSFFQTQLSPSRSHPFILTAYNLNKHVNSGTTVLLFLGRPKEPRTCRLAFQVHVISRLRSYNRARSDTAAVSAALNRIL